MLKSIVPLLGLGLVAAALFGAPKSDKPTVTPQPAAQPAKPTPMPTFNPGMEKRVAELEKEIASLKAQLEERKRAANYWHSKATGRTKAAPVVTYSGGNCANGNCYAPSRRGGGRR